MNSILNKVKGLYRVLLSGSITHLDLNIRSAMMGFEESTAMHFAVRNNDYELLKAILEYQGTPHVEVGLKDN